MNFVTEHDLACARWGLHAVGLLQEWNEVFWSKAAIADLASDEIEHVITVGIALMGTVGNNLKEYPHEQAR
jgi:hypothetical protein